MINAQDLINALTIAYKAGIRSPEQLRLLLEVARAGETDVLTLSNSQLSTDEEAKRIASILRPLYEGYRVKASTGQMGIGLIRSTPGRTPKPGGTRPLNTLRLTPKGKRLIKRLGIDLDG